ncbi:MAG: RHS repeat protein, partial [Deltaproteobacteria bacterium]|nr:RHS repeat protein [Deltaproteobacteria bacterium]
MGGFRASSWRCLCALLLLGSTAFFTAEEKCLGETTTRLFEILPHTSGGYILKCEGPLWANIDEPERIIEQIGEENWTGAIYLSKPGGAGGTFKEYCELKGELRVLWSWYHQEWYLRHHTYCDCPNGTWYWRAEGYIIRGPAPYEGAGDNDHDGIPDEDDFDPKGRINSVSGSGCSNCPGPSGGDYELNDRLMVLASVDGNGNRTRYEYDERGNIIREIEAEGSDSQRITAYTYHPEYALVTSIERESVSPPWEKTVTEFLYDEKGNLLAVHLPTGRSLKYSYGEAGFLERVEDSKGNHIRYFYDREGNRNREEIRDQDGELKRYIDLEYDELNRLLRVLYEGNVLEERRYDGNDNLMISTDANGYSTGYDYDELNRVVRVTHGNAATIFYSYDARDNLTSILDPEGHRTSYLFDDLGNTLRRISPDTGLTIYTYDPPGNMTSKTDANGNIVIYSYDALNRLTEIKYPADPSQNVTYSYDGGTNSKGRLTGMIDPTGSYIYQYDPLGNLIREERTIKGMGFVTEYTYDSTGNLTAVHYPGGRVVTYELDSNGRVAGVSTETDGEMEILAQGITYLPFGPINGFSYGNAVSSKETYDSLYRLTGIDNGSIYHVSYDLDPTGNILEISDNLDLSRSQSFTYDNLYRLTGANGPYGSIRYTYDEAGNRLSRENDAETEVYRYLEGANRLIAVNDEPFTYDANGNITGIGDKAFIYNQENRLIRASKGSQVQGGYTYNGLGQRVIKTSGGEEAFFLYDLRGNVLVEIGSSGEIEREYVYLNGRPLAVIVRGRAVVGAIVDITPGVWRPKGKGKWVTCRIKLPDGYDVRDIEPGSIRLNGLIAPGKVKVRGRGRKRHLVVKFPRESLLQAIDPSPGEEVELEVSGKVGGVSFLGTDTVYVKGKGRKKRKAHIPSPETVHMGDSIYFYHLDHLGTPMAVTDEDGQVVWNATYLPFGKAAMSPNSGVENNLRFPGQYYDQETGLHYNYHRYYDPHTGRYITPDPLAVCRTCCTTQREEWQVGNIGCRSKMFLKKMTSKVIFV